MRNLLFTLLLVAVVPFSACTADKPATGGQDQQQPAGDGAPAAKPVVYDAKCGCSIEGIGKCGNYVLIDGRYVPIVHASLGKMEWCGKKDAGAKIEAVGELKDGKFVATSVKTIE